METHCTFISIKIPFKHLFYVELLQKKSERYVGRAFSINMNGMVYVHLGENFLFKTSEIESV